MPWVSRCWWHHPKTRQDESRRNWPAQRRHRHLLGAASFMSKPLPSTSDNIRALITATHVGQLAPIEAPRRQHFKKYRKNSGVARFTVHGCFEMVGLPSAFVGRISLSTFRQAAAALGSLRPGAVVHSVMVNVRSRWLLPFKFGYLVTAAAETGHSLAQRLDVCSATQSRHFVNRIPSRRPTEAISLQEQVLPTYVGRSATRKADTQRCS